MSNDDEGVTTDGEVMLTGNERIAGKWLSVSLLNSHRTTNFFCITSYQTCLRKYGTTLKRYSFTFNDQHQSQIFNLPTSDDKGQRSMWTSKIALVGQITWGSLGRRNAAGSSPFHNVLTVNKPSKYSHVAYFLMGILVVSPLITLFLHSYYLLVKFSTSFFSFWFISMIFY